MATVQQVAAAHHRRQERLAERAAKQVAALWRRIDRSNIARSWTGLTVEALTVLTSAQGIAAAGAGVYADDALAAQGADVAALGRVNPARFAGVASDGQDLASLLRLPLIRSLTAIKAGNAMDWSMASGLVDLDMIVRTQIADAGRVADGVATAVRPHVGYVRMVAPGACARCIVLAGRTYRWNAGFLRHPRCLCRHIPAKEDMAGDLRTDPRAAFDAMSRAEQDKTFTAAGAQAIREGADISRVVNARRDMYTAGGRALTREATTRRGINRPVRLMPEQIYLEAGDDRDEAIRLLKLHGFIL